MKRTLTTVFMLLAAAILANAQTGTWSGKLEVQGIRLALVFHLDGENPTMDSPDQGAKGIPIEVNKTATGSIAINIPSIGAIYEGQWLIKQIVGTFTQMGASFPLTLTPGAEKLKRPQSPAGPFPYVQEEVSFMNGNAVLKGTLTIPENSTRKTPALIMVTGSGLQNRDEEIFEHKPFAVIADALARAGIATLRYDDRGFGESTGDVVNITTKDLENDALAGIRLLRERFDNVGVIGHSEGGTIALMLAAEKEVEFAVSLAGMTVSGKETLIWQNRLILEAGGTPSETIETYCNALSDVFDANIADMPMPSVVKYNLPEALTQRLSAVIQQIRTPYMHYFLSLDIRPMLKDIACPVLALNGSKDMQVNHQTNLGSLSKGLPANPHNVIDTVDGVNHLFQHCRTGTFDEYREIEETIAPEVLERIVNWVAEM
ncbi:MAG: alpha/beta hydrolase family protein [Candidatus Cryptobacteroides sp.]